MKWNVYIFYAVTRIYKRVTTLHQVQHQHRHHLFLRTHHPLTRLVRAPYTTYPLSSSVYALLCHIKMVMSSVHEKCWIKHGNLWNLHPFICRAGLRVERHLGVESTSQPFLKQFEHISSALIRKCLALFKLPHTLHRINTSSLCVSYTHSLASRQNTHPLRFN